MEGGMAGRGMSASPQPAEIIKLIKQNFLKSWKRGVLARSLKVREFQEVFVLSWPFAVYAAGFLLTIHSPLSTIKIEQISIR